MDLFFIFYIYETEIATDTWLVKSVSISDHMNVETVCILQAYDHEIKSCLPNKIVTNNLL